MRKSVKLFTIGVVVVFGLVACGGGSDEATSVQEDVVESAVLESEEPDEELAVSEAALRMAIVDETSAGIPEEFEVWVRGSGSWFHAQDSLLEQAGPFPVGEPTSFFIYPRGREGAEIEVTLELPQDVIPASVQHMVTIAVFDDEVVVSGTSVPGFEETLRP